MDAGVELGTVRSSMILFRRHHGETVAQAAREIEDPTVHTSVQHVAAVPTSSIANHRRVGCR